MNIGQIVQKPIVQKLHKKTDQLVDSTTLLGVEVEVENYVKHMDYGNSCASYWEIKEDHSLRNNGMEMVFREPLYGADAMAAITWLLEEAKIKGWKISKLTGAHVHVDVRELEVEVFKNLCTVYALTEPLIYNWVGHKRHENMFCLPWYVADADVYTVNKALNQPNADMSLAFLKGLSKYSGLNIGAAVKFGTIEFRMLETTFDLARFTDWLNIILSLKNYAVRQGALKRTPEDICRRLTSVGAYQFASDVFGSGMANKMWYADYLKDAIGLGMVTADWFLENTKELQINTQSLADRFTSIRAKNLSEEYTSQDHQGLKKFKDKLTVQKKAKTKQPKSTVNAPQYAQIIDEVSTVPLPTWIDEIDDDLESEDND